jgi:hypothetical protein
MSKHPTSKENIALDLIFHCVGESRSNRTRDEYAAIAAKQPPQKVLHGNNNDYLANSADEGRVPFEISYFKAGDEHIWYEPFPKSLSIETVRNAEVKSGMRALRPNRRSKR